MQIMSIIFGITYKVGANIIFMVAMSCGSYSAGWPTPLNTVFMLAGFGLGSMS